MIQNPPQSSSLARIFCAALILAICSVGQAFAESFSVGWATNSAVLHSGSPQASTDNVTINGNMGGGDEETLALMGQGFFGSRDFLVSEAAAGHDLQFDLNYVNRLRLISGALTWAGVGMTGSANSGNQTSDVVNRNSVDSDRLADEAALAGGLADSALSNLLGGRGAQFNGRDAFIMGTSFDLSEWLSFINSGRLASGNGGSAQVATNEPVTVPEPASVIFLGTGLCSAAAIVRKRKVHDKNRD